MQKIKLKKHNCNNCSPEFDCKGRPDSENCNRHKSPRSGWMLAELALAYPTSLNEALSALPFDCNLGFYLR